jgi:hypothetical protein
MNKFRILCCTFEESRTKVGLRFNVTSHYCNLQLTLSFLLFLFRLTLPCCTRVNVDVDESVEWQRYMLSLLPLSVLQQLFRDRDGTGVGAILCLCVLRNCWRNADKGAWPDMCDMWFWYIEPGVEARTGFLVSKLMMQRCDGKRKVFPNMYISMGFSLVLFSVLRCRCIGNCENYSGKCGMVV